MWEFSPTFSLDKHCNLLIRGHLMVHLSDMRKASYAKCTPHTVASYNEECKTIELVNAGLVLCNIACPDVVLMLCKY
jgi:hypothetical protein